MDEEWSLRKCGEINVNLRTFDDAELSKHNKRDWKQNEQQRLLPSHTVETAVASNREYTVFSVQWHILQRERKEDPTFFVILIEIIPASRTTSIVRKTEDECLFALTQSTVVTLFILFIHTD